MKIKSVLIIFVLLYNVFSTIASDVITFFNENSIINIGDRVYIFEDTSNSMGVVDVSTIKEFEQSQHIIPNFGTNPNPFWVKIKICNMSDYLDLKLNIAYPTLDKITVFKLSGNTFDSISMGEIFPFNERKDKHPSYIFNTNILKGDTGIFYIKVQGYDMKMLPISIGKYREIVANLSNQDVFIGIYAGIMFVMFLYNLFIYYSTKDRSYLYYIIYILTFGITQVSILGYSYKYFWSNFPWFANFSIVLFSAISGIFAGLFQIKFLNIKEYFPKFYKVFYVFYASYAIAVLLFIIGDVKFSYDLLNINGLPYTFLMLFFAIYISIKGSKPAKFFLIAWSFLLIGIFVFVLRNVGILPYNIMTSFSMQYGSAIEAVLLSFALADRINVLRTEKEQLIKSQNIILEQEVKQRTVALETTNNDLSNTLQELKQTQSQLVDSEKMASLGQLTAGIAHEINNPINFVVANIVPLKRDLNDILLVLEKYSEIKDDDSLKTKLNEIEKLKSDLDTDYLVEEINALLQGIDDGAIRTAEIVKSLKVFSSIDATGLNMNSINDGLRSTLLLLKNKISDKIIVEEVYGDLPKVECHIGKLNQLFMNILDNAIYEIETKKEGERKITIHTSTAKNNVIIKISDTGNGMDEQTKEKIFEPFFTTKEVGKGTGLGLSIAFNIIELHHGNIDIDSTLGKGTVFTITLPIKQEKKN